MPEEATPLAEKQRHIMVSGCFAVDMPCSSAEVSSLLSLLTPDHPPGDLAHCTCRCAHACYNSNLNDESSLGDHPDACRTFLLILFDDLINGCFSCNLTLVSLQVTRVKRDIIV